MRYLRLAAAILLLVGPVSLIPASTDVGIDLCGSSVLFLSKEPRFDTQAQIGSLAALSLEIGVAPHVSLGAELSVLSVADSGVENLVRYRGFRGPRVGLFVSVASEAAGGADSTPAAGVRAGLGGAVYRYADTGLLFVAPLVVAEPFLLFPVGALRWLWVRVAVPLAWHFRPDLSIAGSAGFSFGARFVPGRKARDGA